MTIRILNIFLFFITFLTFSLREVEFGHVGVPLPSFLLTFLNFYTFLEAPTGALMRRAMWVESFLFFSRDPRNTRNCQGVAPAGREEPQIIRNWEPGKREKNREPRENQKNVRPENAHERRQKNYKK